MTETPGHRLRVVAAVEIPEHLLVELERREPRAEIVRDPSLQRPMRWTADWGGDPSLTRSPRDQAAYDAMVDSADVLLSLPDADPTALARTVRANPRLRWVHTMAAGGGAAVRAAGLSPDELRRVTFTTSAGVHASTLAEFAVFGVLAGAKELPRLRAAQQGHEWNDRWMMRHLEEMTVLIVGLGGIGQATAVRFAAFGATVWGTTRSGRPVDGVNRLVAIEELAQAARDADAIVVTLPGTARTEGLIGADLLRAAKPGVILVNVGRGTVVDEEALVAGLDDGQVSFAALDVFATEPLPTTSPLWDHPRVLVSPHTAALSAQEDIRILRLFADNLRRFLDGEPLRNVVDTVEFY